MGWMLIFFLLTQKDFKAVKGDVLSLTVFGEESISGKYEIEEDGTVNIPPLGRIKVEGLNVVEIESVISGALKEGYMVHPVVKVEIIPSPLRNVFVLGEVKSPGSYDPRQGNTVIDYILIAGGPSPSAGDTLTLMRREGPYLKRVGSFSISELIRKGDAAPEVQPGDVIYVSRKEEGMISSLEGSEKNAFYVVGEVKSPGAYEYREGFRVLDGVLSAGGPTEFSALGKVKIYRNVDGKREVLNVDLESVIKKGKTENNLEIRPGDIIYIPASIF